MKLLSWKIITLEINGGGAAESPEHPPGYAPVWEYDNKESKPTSLYNHEMSLAAVNNAL